MQIMVHMQHKKDNIKKITKNNDKFWKRDCNSYQMQYL